MSTPGGGALQRARGLRTTIAANLRVFRRVPASAPLVPAAVAVVVLQDGNGDACIPLFVRAAGLARHPGQVALPGGKLDHDEGAEAAALRELREELGLTVTDDGILGSLDDYETHSGFTITPVVVWSRSNAAGLQPSSEEVAELFLLKLEDLRSAVAGATRGASRAFCLELPWGPVYAPTAAILYQFSEVALDGRPTRVKDFYQPPFARR
ncbi:MAG: CoA pyrophosphatase [Candidatus Dormibacteraeota bacterium]|nr:CoA pyrophosphatase [Candidatus Dormibacteraeota bacterium]